MSIGTVAILGGGIMGCSAALEFARRGVRPVVFDAAGDVLGGASRWNEGKIHLGYLYSADASMATARKVLPGGLQFRPLIEQLIETSIADVITPSDDLFLCHASSVVTPRAMEAYFHQLDELVRAHPDAKAYLADASRAAARRLQPDELRRVSPSADIVAGFAVPERSVHTNWIADRLAAAVRTNSAIELRSDVRVLGVSEDARGRWHVATETGADGPFDCVVNALWQGRLAVDATAGIPPPREWSHRYRVSLFVRSRTSLALPSAVIAAGPFGDIKNYNGRDFYLSWYPAGLLSESSELQPAEIGRPGAGAAAEISRKVFSSLAEFIPGVEELSRNPERMEIGGGWVYAAASGSLSDPEATLHRRKDFGITRKGSYLSVDTGKYSTAPWLARKVAGEIFGEE